MISEICPLIDCIMPIAGISRCCLLVSRQNALLIPYPLRFGSCRAHLSSTSQLTKVNLVKSFHQNVNWFNNQYEKVFGIAGTREMQNRVIEVESEFVEVTQKRKICENKMEQFQNEIQRIRDKLEVTPRHSDEHLELFNKERSLLREKLTLDVQLADLKEREQFLLDNLSRLLRQSHELERLKLERAKYWQIISIALSLAGSLVAIVAQRGRSQKLVSEKLSTLDEKLLLLENSLKAIELDSERQSQVSREIVVELNKMNACIYEIAHKLVGIKRDSPQHKTGWIPRLPGVSILKSWLGYSHS